MSTNPSFPVRRRGLSLACCLALAGVRAFAQGQHRLPDHVPPKRSSQIHDGFGINSDLPREPYLPWTRWWWTRMFDAGVKWIRIGQYENSSEPTSWDWVEQKRGVYAVSPEVDDYVDSLIENGVDVQVQLLYGNPMYTSPAGKRPDQITPAPGSFHNDDRSLFSIFWPPTTPEQIEAFSNYVRWMADHFRGRIDYYALWNEEDIGYWNPWGDPEEYGHLLRAFIPAVHETDPGAKVIFGGLADPRRDWARRALDACQCAAGIDVFAYHTYPGYGQNLNPESMDAGAYGLDSPSKLRELVRNYPGIRKDIPFWDDEFNSIPSWTGSDESVQAKYVTRGMLYNWAEGVKTFVWLLAAGTDGNEYDDFGLVHGLRYLPDDFTPRPVFSAFQNVNALFSDTKLDSKIQIQSSEIPALHRQSGGAFLAHGFRTASGKAIIAYWLAAHSNPGNVFPALAATLTLTEFRHQTPRAHRRGFGRNLTAYLEERHDGYARRRSCRRQGDGHCGRKLFRLGATSRSAEFARCQGLRWLRRAFLGNSRRRNYRRGGRAPQGQPRHLGARCKAFRGKILSRYRRALGTDALLPGAGG